MPKDILEGSLTDTNVAVDWKEANSEEMTELLGTEYSTEMYDRLEKLVNPVFTPPLTTCDKGSFDPSEDDCDFSFHGCAADSVESGVGCFPEQYSTCSDGSHDSYKQPVSPNSAIPDRNKVYGSVKRVIFGKKTDKLTVKALLSDFAGQLRFFHFQLLFLKKQDVIVLTINAAVNPHNAVIPREQLTYTRNKRRAGMMTTLESVHHWLQSISANCGTSDAPVGSLSRHSPTVITCFTHAEKLSEKQQRKIISIFRDSLSQKPYAAHLPEKDEDAFHMISNKNRNKFKVNIMHLQLTLLKAAKPSIEEQRPISYLKLEESIAKKVKEGHNTLSLLEYTLLANQAGIEGGANSDTIFASLQYYTKRGIILYFAEISALVDTVFISPQWLSNLFSHIIKAHDLVPKDRNLQCSWKRYDQHAIIEEPFLDFILQDSHVFEYKEIILALTKHFYLIAELLPNARFAGETNSSIVKGSVFVVPALLSSKPTLHHYKPSSSDQVLLFLFPDEYFPEFIMNHVLVMTINWSVSNGFSVHEYVYK